MSAEFEPKPQFVVSEMTVEDIEPATAMRLQSWLDTYTNESAGVTKEWIENRNKTQLSLEKQESRKKRFLDGKTAGYFNAWVAKDFEGNIVGSTTPFVTEAGTQRLGSLYVDKNHLGKGIADALMQKVVDWHDPEKPIELIVVQYNERAKAFYRKWGFEEVPDSFELAEDVIPEVKMVRPGVKDEI